MTEIKKEVNPDAGPDPLEGKSIEELKDIIKGQEKITDEQQEKITTQDKEIHRLQVMLFSIIDYLDKTENGMNNLRQNLKDLIVPKQNPSNS